MCLVDLFLHFTLLIGILFYVTFSQIKIKDISQLQCGYKNVHNTKMNTGRVILKRDIIIGKYFNHLTYK